MNTLFIHELKSENMYFKYANGKSIAEGKEFHTFNELIFFLGDKARLITEKINMELKPQTLILIPKESYHQIVIEGDEQNYLRCIFHFDDSPFYRACFSDVSVFYADERLTLLFGILQEKAQNKNISEVDIILKSVLALITDSLSQKQSAITVTEHSRLADNAIEYINQNINKKFSCQDIAKSLHVSLSTLQHTFKNEMKISLYSYILKKRLVLARTQILSGIPATTVSVELGFSDYSGFYKQYKKLFGVTPNNTKTK